jgi:uncharacterized damage-inducible protein DinB
MNAKDAIKHALNMNHQILTTYLSDLSDADLLVRPVPGANHIAWQLGHLIAAEGMLLKETAGARPPELPAGFAEQHGKEKAASNSPEGFRTKQEYLDLYAKAREATLQALANLPEADLDKPITGRMAQIAPTVGALFLLTANHELMHAGQFAVVRRKLGKPVLI